MSKKDKFQEIPYYLQVKELIKSKIESGEYDIGYKLPQLETLAENFGLHKLTVRTGIQLLVKEGYLKTIPGKGTYVIKKPEVHTFINFDSYIQNVNEDNTVILEKCTREAGHYFSDIFSLEYNDLIYKFVILKIKEKEPFSVSYIYVKEDVIKKLSGFDLKVFSLDEIYDLYNLNITKTIQNLEACYTNKKITKYLGLETDQPVLKITSLKYIEDNVFEYKVNYTRSDICSFANEF